MLTPFQARVCVADGEQRVLLASLMMALQPK